MHLPIHFVVALFFFVTSIATLSTPVVAATWPAAEWPQSAPEDQGMDSAELAAMLGWIEDRNTGIRSVTVVRHGTVVLDAYISPFTSSDRHEIRSCTKSVLSMLVGIAIDRGDLPGLDTPILDFFPGYEGADQETGKHALTLEHLLTMSAGLKTEDSYLYGWVGLRKMRASRDWAQYVLDLPLEVEPGTRFEYSNCVSQLMAIILQEATGRSLADYADEHLFEPIGIVDYTWEGSRAGDSWGFAGLGLHPLDFARLGYLYLRGGEWDGVQIVPAEWVANSTASQIVAGTLADGYGYQWWVDGDMFMMQGHGGQLVAVAPAHDLVVVFTGALPQRRYFTPRRPLSDYIELAVVADHELPANPAAVARLDSLIRVLGDDVAETPRPLPDLARTVSGQTFEFVENKMGLRHLTLHFTPGLSDAELEFDVGGMVARLTIGLDDVFRVSELFGQRWACRGRWVDDEVFVIDQEVLGKVLSRRISLTFQGDSLSFEVHDRIMDMVGNYSAKKAGTSPDAR
jgi:CubicO group peptidase (beta-lactamase class C family)